MANTAYPDTIYLFIDASAVEPWVGILKSGQWLALHTSPHQALESIFKSADQCLKERGLALRDIQGFIHCEGPGSVLGIRLSAMAIRSWQALPLWHNATVKSYQSLHLIRAILGKQYQADRRTTLQPFHVISEARKDTWNCLSHDDPTIRIINHDTLHHLEGPVHHYQQRKSWHQAPATALPFTLELKDCADYFYDPTLVTATEHPMIFEAQTTDYKKWDNTRHR